MFDKLGRKKLMKEKMEKIYEYFKEHCGEENKWVIVGARELSEKTGIGVSHSTMTKILKIMADEGHIIRELYGNKEIPADTRPRYKLNK